MYFITPNFSCPIVDNTKEELIIDEKLEKRREMANVDVSKVSKNSLLLKMMGLKRFGFKIELEGLGADPEVKVVVYRNKKPLFRKAFIGKVAEIVICGHQCEESRVDISSREGEKELDYRINIIMLKYNSFRHVPWGFKNLE